MIMVRPARPGDEAAVFQVHVRAIRETASRCYGAEQIAAWSGNLRPEIYTGTIEAGRLFVAEESGQVVGFGDLDPASGEVTAIYVLPEAQGRGIGGALLAEAENRARRAGLREIRLVSSVNAVGFYERHGFVSSGRSLHTLRSGGVLESEKMHKELGQEASSVPRSSEVKR
jgi:ribosomal protein S18 acetylase RimI-like enzyme